jgi:hypothetical protein
VTATIGATRRLRALTRIGWHVDAIVFETGLTPAQTVGLLWSPPKEIAPSIHEHLAIRYRQMLIEVPPYTTDQGQQAIAVAHAAGWPGPMDWDDIDHDAATSSSSRDEPIVAQHLASRARALEVRVAELTATVQSQENDLARILAEQLRSDAALIIAITDADAANERLDRAMHALKAGVAA